MVCFWAETWRDLSERTKGSSTTESLKIQRKSSPIGVSIEVVFVLNLEEVFLDASCSSFAQRLVVGEGCASPAFTWENPSNAASLEANVYWRQDNFRGNCLKRLRLDSPGGIQEASSGFHRIRADSPGVASRQLAGSAKESTVAALPG